MKQIYFTASFILFCCSFQLMAQNVGVGSTTPPSKLTVVGSSSDPSIPGPLSSGVLRVGVGDNDNEGIDFGKQSTPPFTGWIQAGFNGNTTDPLSVQPLGGNVGIGTTSPNAQFQLGNTASNRKIVLFEGVNNDHQFYGLGINTSMLRYQVDATTSSHAFFAGTGTSTSSEIMRIQGIGNVGIGTISPAPSAALHINSTTRGFLPPRMTLAQRNAIASPAEGLMISCTDCSVKGLHQYINGAWQEMTSGNTGNYGTVTNPITGKTWLDRNLGATQVATSSTDAASYGDLYQWGRAADGHQVRTSATQNTQATTWLADEGSTLWDGKFIISFGDWLTPAAMDLWSGTAAENNPCPSGFRVPTNAEWNQERRTWSSNNAAGAFASPLKLPMAGFRNESNGSVYDVGTFGVYWSSTASSSVGARSLSIISSNALMYSDGRAYGYSVRCIKD